MVRDLTAARLTISILVIVLFAVAVPAQKKRSITLKIYFVDLIDNENVDDCGKVRAVERKIPWTRGVARAALNELFKGPTEEERKKGSSSIFSESSAEILHDIKVKKGAAYVSLKESVVPNFGVATTSCGGAAFFAEVENTLKQFPTVKKVFFSIEKDPEAFYEWMQIGECPEELLDSKKKCSGKDF